MRKTEDQLVVKNPKAESIAEAIGISNERRLEIQKEITKICKQNEDKPHSETIALVYNTFEKRAECAFALYILEHVEDYVTVHSLFKLPEAVGAEV